jgi:hypothetical protein
MFGIFPPSVSPKSEYWIFSLYFIQHCSICRPSDYTVSEDAGIEPRTVASSALAVRRNIKTNRYILKSIVLYCFLLTSAIQCYDQSLSITPVDKIEK